MMRMELERRPLLILCLFLILGLTIPRNPVNLLFLCSAGFFWKSPRLLAICAAGFLLGVVLGPGEPPKFVSTQTYVGGQWQVVTTPKLKPYGQRCEVQQGVTKLALTYAGPVRLCPGDVLQVSAVVKPPNEGSEDYFRTRGLSGKLFVEEDQLRVLEPGPWHQKLALAWRDKFMSLAATHLQTDAAAAASALTFNVDGFLDEDTAKELRYSGTTHLIAASGLQVLIIGQCLFWLCAFLPVPRAAQLLVVTLLLCFYGLATGLHPPVVRAIIMSLAANAAWMVRREPDWVSALALGAIVCLVWQPGTVYEIGFHLSFIAVLFLHLFAFKYESAETTAGSLALKGKALLQTTVVATFAVSPLIAYSFGYVAPVSLLANILMVGAATSVVWISILAVPIATIAPDLAAGAVQVTALPIGFIYRVLNTFGQESWTIDVPPFSAYWLVPFYLLLVAIWRPRARPA